ncbi:MAG: hypothetical protein ACK5YB_02400 [Burkholderiales bacterium]
METKATAAPDRTTGAVSGRLPAPYVANEYAVSEGGVAQSMSSQGAAIADARPQAAAQRCLADAIHGSPRMMAQRKAIGAMKSAMPVQAQMAVVQREEEGYEDDSVDTDGADMAQARPIDETAFDQTYADEEMPLSAYLVLRAQSVGDEPIIQMAAPFGGTSTNTYHVVRTANTHTVSYNRIGKGGIDFDNPASVAPPFGVSIQNNGDSVNILHKYMGDDYINIKPKGKFVYTWIGNEKARSLHFRAANLLKGYGGSGQPYGGWTWHHQAPNVASRGTMVPVLTDVHKRHNHNGGVSLW